MYIIFHHIKLRKRDDSSASTTTAVNTDSQQPQQGHQNRNYSNIDNYNEALDRQLLPTTTVTECKENSTTMGIETITFARVNGGCTTSKGWIFPPKAPSPNIYNCGGQDTMVTVGERNGFKGFKKQFSGRFKRLVFHKKDATSPIPPELKPQLKTIYVY